MKFLVIGCGSIGERHIRNLQALSVGEIVAYDVDSKRLSLIEEKYKIEVHDNLSQASNQHIDAFIICVPPSLHLLFAVKGVEHNAHIFLEKPISHNLEGIDTLIGEARLKGLILYVGYNLRFHPGLQLTKRLVDEGRIGRVLSAIVEAGQYLPDWHPWQDYRQIYTAKKDLGGGIILDASHELDYVRWLIGGEVRAVSCFAGKISSLEVETEDIAEIILQFDNDVIAGVHLDFVQRAYSRSCKLIGEQGTIIWSYPEKKVKFFSAALNQWQETEVEGEPNDMYLEEMKHFIKCVKGEDTPVADGATGKRVLEIALAAKESAETDTVIRV